MSNGGERGPKISQKSISYEWPLNTYICFSLYQTQIALLYLVTLSAGVAVVVFAFTAYVPKYRCRIPSCESSTESTTYNDPDTGEPFDFVKMAIGMLPSDGKKTIGNLQHSFTNYKHNFIGYFYSTIKIYQHHFTLRM